VAKKWQKDLSGFKFITCWYYL